MLFKFLEKPIEITTYVPTNYSFANIYSPIKPSSHFIPNWWKNVPKSNEKFLTTRSCVGILKTFQTGYVLPMWCDLSLTINEDLSWRYQFSDSLSSLIHHSNKQMSGFSDNYFIFKIDSPWIIETTHEINFFVCEPFYFSKFEKPYSIASGIVTTFTKQCTTNFFLFIEKKPNDIFINLNTPMLHIIPITEKKIKFKTEVISNEEYIYKSNTHSAGISFHSKGLNMLKILRKQKNG